MLLADIPEHAHLTLVIFPSRTYGIDHRWIMKALKLCPDGALKWRHHFIDNGNGHAAADLYDSYADAIHAADQFNAGLRERTTNAGLEWLERESLELRADKEVTALRRRTHEEQIMLQEAIRRHASDQRPRLEDIDIYCNASQTLLPLLHEILLTTPYVELANIHKHRTILAKVGEHQWRQVPSTDKNVMYCFREKIARGFGIPGSDHWGQTKATIRSMLLPRANKLLQHASVQKILLEARAKGLQVVVIGGFVLWYEGKTAQWVVKATGGESGAESGNTIWYEGTILSKNHGRIVVLPYIKQNSERIQGHTKNAPHDGKALPRHPSEYIELPFEVLDGDLMIGLFGDLPYE